MTRSQSGRGQFLDGSDQAFCFGAHLGKTRGLTHYFRATRGSAQFGFRLTDGLGPVFADLSSGVADFVFLGGNAFPILAPAAFFGWHNPP